MSLIIPANSASVAGGFSIDNSCRFDNAYSGTGASDYLTRTYSAGNRRTFTISFWIKRSGLFVSQWQQVLGQYDVGADQLFRVGYNSSEQGDVIRCYGAPGGFEFRTTALYRDVSAWYHVVLAIDTTQGTEANRAKLYVNGTQVTSFVTANYPGQNVELHYNEGKAHSIGRAQGGNQGLPAYLAQLISIDGTAYAASDFGEFDEDSGIWKPKDVSGLTFGSQGFYLDFADSGDLGDDESGNGNDWTETGIAAVNQSTDTPTNNFPTLNPLAIGSFPVLSEGNLSVRANSDAEYGNIIGTFSTSSSGKWYYEIKVIGKTGTSPWVGLIVDDAPKAGIATNGGANSAGSSSFSAPSFVIQSDGQVTQAGSAGTTYTSFAIGDIISFSIDMDNGACYIAKNGTYMNSGNPASAGSKTGAIITWTAGSISGFLPAISVYGAGTSSGSFSAVSMNFGSPTFAISSGNTDGDGYGNFEYAVPSGYFALCTKNLAEYG